jgi:hypothetical protein
MCKKRKGGASGITQVPEKKTARCDFIEQFEKLCNGETNKTIELLEFAM